MSQKTKSSRPIMSRADALTTIAMVLMTVGLVVAGWPH